MGASDMDVWMMFQKAAEAYGLPFALFIALLVWVLWTNNKREDRYIAREEKYIEIVQTLSEDVKERLAIIETKLGG